MEIQNLQRANDLAKELKELKAAISFLQGGGVVKVCGNDTFACVLHRGTKDKILKVLHERTEEILEEIKTL